MKTLEKCLKNILINWPKDDLEGHLQKFEHFKLVTAVENHICGHINYLWDADDLVYQKFMSIWKKEIFESVKNQLF